MKRTLNIIVLLILSTIFTASFAQSRHYDPDTLQVVTVNGFAIVDTTIGMDKMYYLDEDNDGTPDYFLNFGPWWYEPDSSTATRPNDAAQITITGGLAASTMMNGYPTIIVYEINGEFWRDPYDPFWNHMGTNHGSNYMMDSCYTSGFGWMHNSLETISLSGHTLIDTTFIMAHYYLDTDNDGTPDYYLNFGPPWYESTSGAVRPEFGDSINIVGGMLNNGLFPMLVVYEINGLQWRDSSSIGQQFGGGWIHRNMNGSQQFHTPYDSMDRVTMNPGWWSNGGGHNGGMSDSLFCQILEIFPKDIHTLGNENAFAGYEMDFFSTSMMGGGMSNQMGCGGHMNFNSNADFQFHFTDEQLTDANITASSVKVKYWDSDINQWKEISNATLNTINNTFTFSQTTAANFFILTGDSPTSVESSGNALPDQFILKQNYPNPFNPSTTIEFSLPVRTKVKLTVSNILGEKIAELADGIFNSGNYSIKFDGKDLSSGIYFYQLITDKSIQVKKMQLIK